ncbi:MAG: hypothetical protein Tsb009_10030 [Planctomycetaceae bacterium]
MGSAFQFVRQNQLRAPGIHGDDDVFTLNKPGNKHHWRNGQTAGFRKNIPIETIFPDGIGELASKSAKASQVEFRYVDR